MTEQPLVSVFIPYYNDRLFLRQSIESVLNSTYKNFELVLLNHGTTDDCREIAHSYNDLRIKHIDMPYNLGYGGSGLLLKEFLKIAQGKYIKPLCADDMLKPDGLEKLVNYMEENPQKDFAFGNVEYIDSDGKSLHDNWFSAREGFNINDNEADCIRKYSWTCSFLPYVGSIIKKEILFNITINTTLIMMFDMSLWAELLCQGYKIGFCNSMVVDYRIHENQVSGLKNKEFMENELIYEFPTFWTTFIGIKDINLAKEVYKASKYVDLLKDEKDIPFFVAQALIELGTPLKYSYIYLSSLFSNDEQRNHIEKTFGYTIKDLRKTCLADYDNQQKIKHPQKHTFKNFKNKIYYTPSKNLGLRALAFLLVHRMYNIITLQQIREYYKNKRKRKYSL